MGRKLDPDQLNVLGTTLSGDAVDWYYQNLVSPYHIQQYWTFKHAVNALYQCFIITDTFQQATNQFYDVQYHRKGGVAALYQVMLYWSQCILEHPPELLFKECFLLSIPEDMEQAITIGWGINHMVIPARGLYKGCSQV